MRNHKKKLSVDEFFKLPIKEQEKIMADVAGEANKDQRELIRRYNKQFGKADAASSS